MQPSDHDLLMRLDEAINGKDTGLKDSVKRMEGKLDAHFTSHYRERNAVIAALASALIAIGTGLIAIFTGK